MSSATTPHSPLQEALLSPDSALRGQLVTMGLDALLACELGALLRPADVAAWVVEALSPQPVAQAAQRLWPLWGALRARVEAEGVTVGAHLPPDLPDAVSGLLASARWPNAPWLADALDPAPLRDLLAPVVQQVLISFTRKLPLVGGGGAARPAESGGLMGMLRKQAGEQAKRLLDASRSVADRLGLGEDRLQQLTYDFTQQAIDETRAALTARLATDEGRALLTQLQRHALQRLLSSPAAPALADLDAFAHPDLDALCQHLVAFTSQDPWWRQLIQDALALALAQDAHTPLATWLADAHLLDATRAALTPAADALAVALISQARFVEWVRAISQLL